MWVNEEIALLKRQGEKIRIERRLKGWHSISFGGNQFFLKINPHDKNEIFISSWDWSKTIVVERKKDNTTLSRGFKEISRR